VRNVRTNGLIGGFAFVKFIVIHFFTLK